MVRVSGGEKSESETQNRNAITIKHKGNINRNPQKAINRNRKED